MDRDEKITLLKQAVKGDPLPLQEFIDRQRDSQFSVENFKLCFYYLLEDANPIRGCWDGNINSIEDLDIIERDLLEHAGNRWLETIPVSTLIKIASLLECGRVLKATGRLDVLKPYYKYIS